MKQFLSQVIDFKDNDTSKTVVSWSAKNIINGLTYGNGGIKCWPKEFVLNMKTHENANPDNERAQVDFCWEAEYLQQNEVFSTIHNNASPYQAWRAGFREGVKMCLDQGVMIPKDQIKYSHWKNLHRLYIWCMVGADIVNGDYAIGGARYGIFRPIFTDWDYRKVRDFDELKNEWERFEFKSSYDAYKIGS